MKKAIAIQLMEEQDKEDTIFTPMNISKQVISTFESSLREANVIEMPEVS